MPLHRFDSLEHAIRSILRGEPPGGVMCEVQLLDAGGRILALFDEVPFVQVDDELKRINFDGSGSTAAVLATGRVETALVDGIPTPIQGTLGAHLRQGDMVSLG